DHGASHLAPGVVRDADDRALQHAGMGEDRVLHLGGVDVLAAGDDHVLGAVDDVGVAVLVDAGHVAAAEPAVGERRGGIAGAPPVAAHDVGAPDHDLPGLAGRDVLHAGSDD